MKEFCIGCSKALFFFQTPYWESLLTYVDTSDLSWTLNTGVSQSKQNFETFNFRKKSFFFVFAQKRTPEQIIILYYQIF